MTFQEIDLQIRESSISGYTVTLLSGREQLAEAFLRHSEEIRRLPGALEAYLQGGDPAEVHDLAGRLHSQVFQGPVERAFEQVRGGGPVRLRIRPEPPEIARLPWESLHDGSEPLSVSPEIAFSRLPLDAQRRPGGVREPDVGVLVATAEVSGTEEADALEAVFTGLRQDGLVHLVTLRGASLDDIQVAMESGRFRVVAIVAPGPLGTDGTTGYLRLRGDGGRLREHAVTEIATVLNAHPGLRFLLLSAGCNAHADWRGDSFEGLIRLCFGMKVAAALSLPHPFGSNPYVRFLRAFFEGTIGGHALDVAAGAARRGLHAGGGVEYALPRIFASDPFCLRVMEAPPRKDLDAIVAIAAPAGVAATGRIGRGVQKETDHTAPTEELLIDQSLLQGEIPEEEAEMEEAVGRFAEEGDWKNQAAAMDHLGRYQARRGRARKAIVNYQQALGILREKGEERSILHVLLHLADAYQQAGETERAMETYKQHLSLAERLGEDRKAAVSLTRIGDHHHRGRNLSLAVAVWRRALKIWQAANEEGRAAELLTKIGAALQSMGHFEEATSSFEGGLYIQRQRQDFIGMATSLNNLGNVATRRGQRDEAVARYSEALDFFRQVESREGIASVCHNLSNISLSLGDHRRCLELALETRSIAKDLGIESLSSSTDRLLLRLRSKLGEEGFRKLEADLQGGAPQS